MKTKEEINIEIEKLQQELRELDNNDYQEVEHNNKTFRIYKWDDKPYGDLINNPPKGFRLSEFQKFFELVESNKFEFEVWRYYIIKHFNKLQWDTQFGLARAYLSLAQLWNSNLGCLASSDDDGSVVLVK